MARGTAPTETTRLLGPEEIGDDDGTATNMSPAVRYTAKWDALHMTTDSNLFALTTQLEWASPSDPGNPKNWKSSRKWTCAMIVSFYCLVSPTAAAMVVPAMPALARDLHITSEAILQLTMTLFVLGWTSGPLVMGPLSEVFGRAPILHLGSLGFITFNLLCAFVRDARVFLLLRLASGICGSGPTALGTGVLSDLWESDKRGFALAIYTIMPLLGPTVGPLLAGYIVQHYDWPYIFCMLSLISAVLLVPGVMLLPETFGPVILRRRRAAKLQNMGQDYANTSSKTTKHHTTRELLRKGLARPFILLGTQPIVQVLALQFGFYFGLYQLSIATYHSLWRDVYHMDPLRASANYLSITLGLVLGCEVAGPLGDSIYRTLKRRHGGVGLPEYRVWLMLPSALLVPGGLLWFGWAAAARAHWLVPNAGMAAASAGLVMSFVCMQAYMMDAYPVYAASAQGALTVARALAAFSMPVAAPALLGRWGYGWSCTMLAGIAAVLGVLAPAVLHWKGAALRAMSPYAAGDVILED
ncbi:MFS multidrug transporter [Apiospora marii]|uniref:MFS multidrug transporter n=1 Tax=Apiospora marii TaxID=335849 RepID=A0ABR1SJJ5_9PEZI